MKKRNVKSESKHRSLKVKTPIKCGAHVWLAKQQFPLPVKVVN